MKFRAILISAATLSVTAALAQTQPSTQLTTQPAAAVSASAPTATTQAAVASPPRELPPALAAALRAAATQPKPAGALIPKSASFRDAYQVVVDRNMFTRTHYIRSDSSANDARRLSEAERAARRQVLVLTGVIEETGQYVAFIESTRTGETERHKAGDSLVQGKVVRIDFDSIVYDNGNGGAPIRIEVGMNLDGRLPDFGSYSSGSSSGNNSGYSSNSAGATTAPAGSPPGSSSAANGPPPPPGSGGDIAERLRQRRLQETKQGAGQ